MVSSDGNQRLKTADSWLHLTQLYTIIVFDATLLRLSQPVLAPARVVAPRILYVQLLWWDNIVIFVGTNAAKITIGLMRYSSRINWLKCSSCAGYERLVPVDCEIAVAPSAVRFTQDWSRRLGRASCNYLLVSNDDLSVMNQA